MWLQFYDEAIPTRLVVSDMAFVLFYRKQRSTPSHIATVKSLLGVHDISKPIQDCITACVQHKFQLVDEYTMFHLLHSEVTKFYDAESNYRQACLSLVRLYHILILKSQNQPITNCIYDAHPHVFLLHEINELTKLIPTLQSLSYCRFVSHRPKLWQYFREMRWFENGDSATNEQNIQFDHDYNLLSSVLSSYGTLQEAVIMESLRPVAPSIYSWFENWNRARV